MQNACVTEPGLAPRGHSTLYVLVPVAHRKVAGVDSAGLQDRFRQQMIDRLTGLGVPDLARRIRFEKVVSPLGWENDMQIFRGATFNLTHSLDGW